MSDKMSENRSRIKFCVYCYETQEPECVYRAHFMFTKSEVVICPKLRLDGCPNCGGRFDKAHPVDMCTYDPQKRQRRERPPPKPKAKKTQSLRAKLLKRLGGRALY